MAAERGPFVVFGAVWLSSDDGMDDETTTGGGRGRALAASAFAAPLLVLVIAFSMQSGSALATRVIEEVGVVEALWLRTAIAGTGSNARQKQPPGS